MATAPTTSSRVEQKRADRGEAILDTVLKLVEREGLEAVTVQRVATEHGYVAGALYRYFPSKDAMLAALQRRVIGEVHGYLRDELATFQASEGRKKAPGAVGALADLLVLSEGYLRLPGVMPGHHGLISLLLGDPRALVSAEESRKAAAPLGVLLGRATALLAAATDAGALANGDAGARTLVLWSSLQGSLLLGKLSRIDPAALDAQSIGRAGVRALLSGWGAPQGALGRAEKLVQG